MKVKCISNERDWLRGVYDYDESETEIYYTGLKVDQNYKFPLVVGKEYLVYALALNCGEIWYFLADETYNFYPVLFPGPLFKVIDNSLSKYWVYSYQTGTHFIKAQTTWAFPEWAEDPDFYTKLTSSYEREILLFKKYKELMDVEFI